MAAINFPNSPADGQEFIASNTLYTYVQSKNLWKAQTLGGGSGGVGSSSLAGLTDVNLTSIDAGDMLVYNGTFFVNTDLKYRQIAYPCAAAYNVTNLGAVYKLSNVPSNPDNPAITVFAGTTVRFDLSVASDPLQIKTISDVNYSQGLIHIDDQGNVSTHSEAQGKTTGSLYWQVPTTAAGTYKYQSGVRSAMYGVIKVKGAGNEPVKSITSSGSTLALDLAESNVFVVNLSSNISTVNFNNISAAGSTITVVLTNTGNFDISWPNNISWAQGSPPVLTSSGTDIISLISINSGIGWYGFVSGQNFG
jgi:hypothetical protein